MKIALTPPATYAARCLALICGGFLAFASHDMGVFLMMVPLDLLCGLLLFRRDYVARREDWIVTELRFRRLLTTRDGLVEVVFAALSTGLLILILPWSGGWPIVFTGFLLFGAAFRDLRRRTARVPA